eukprot:902418-Amphidinium_carterae.1
MKHALYDASFGKRDLHKAISNQYVVLEFHIAKSTSQVNTRRLWAKLEQIKCNAAHRRGVPIIVTRHCLSGQAIPPFMVLWV